MLVLAQGDNLNTVIVSIAKLIQDGVIPIIIGITLLVFLWGVLRYGMSKDEAERKDSLWIITNGIIVLFVMISVWGLVWLFAEFFGVNLNSPINLQNKNIQTDSLIIRR